MLVSGTEPKISMETDTVDFIKNMRISGSLENTIFYEDLNFIASKKDKMTQLKKEMDLVGETTEEGKKIKAEMKAVNAEVEAYREDNFNKYPDLLYTKFLKAATDIKIPEAPINPDGTKDSTFALRYVRYTIPG